MTLWTYRDTRTERLVEMLAQRLAETRPGDVMTPVTVVVGSRGMQRWLNHELATLQGSVAGIDYLFPANAFARASAAVCLAAGEAPPASEDIWSGLMLHRRVIRAIRARLDDDAFTQVRRYIGDGRGAVGARELAFAREVATVIERLLYDRSEEAAAWIDDPAVAGAHRWLGLLLHDLRRGSAVGADPPARLALLTRLPPQRLEMPLFVFGLSSLRRGDKAYLAALSRHLDIHLFMLVPSMNWWADIHSRRQERTALWKTADPAERTTLLRLFERSNPLLATHGAPSRDLQLWLEELDYQSLEDEREPPLPVNRLQVLQQWINAAEEPLQLGEQLRARSLFAADGDVLPSIEINACHGALRQCEALRDELLRRFAHNPTLEPRHVLVMTPDLSTHAPLIAAVFGRERRGADPVPAIPVQIADLGLTDTNPVAAVLLDVMELVGSRVTASALLQLLSREPVRTRFRLDDDDLAALKDLVVASGLRWAWDADDRGRHGQPAVDQNTVRFALERLALGMLMPDPGGLEVLPGGNGLGPAVPLDLQGRDQALRFGTLAAVCNELQSLQQALSSAATAGEWRARLERIVERLCSVPETRLWQRTRVLSTLHELLPDDEASLQFAADSIASLLRDAFTLPRGGDRPNTGAVTVCSMEPMRSVPFRIVAMLGMDDDAFPRPASKAAWDPMATSRWQEHDRRSLDRHLFLESILCAREALLIYGRGFESTRGERVPLSVVVEEFVDLLAVALGVEDSRTLLRVHPLQPWSAAAFADPARRPFDTAWAEAARAYRGERQASGLAATSPSARWPRERELPSTLDASALARALENAPKAFFEQALQIPTTAWDVEVQDREPIELDELQAWRIRDDLLKLACARDGSLDLGLLLQRQQAIGAIPFEAGGEEVLAAELSKALAVFEVAARLGGEQVSPPPYQYLVQVEGRPPLALSAVVPQVRVASADGQTGGHIHVWMRASNDPSDKLLLQSWLALLIAVASGVPVVVVFWATKSGVRQLKAPTRVAAIEYLQTAVALWWRARREPLLLVPAFSRELAALSAANPAASAESLVRDGLEYWFENDGNAGSRARAAMGDTAARGLFGSMTEDDLESRAGELVELARKVWFAPLAVLEKIS